MIQQVRRLLLILFFAHTGCDNPNESPTEEFPPDSLDMGVTRCVPNGPMNLISEGMFGECEYETPCAVSGIQKRIDQYCINREVVEVELTRAMGCDRTVEATNGVVVETGGFGECVHENECTLAGTKTRTDRVCENGEVVNVNVESSDGCDRVAADSNGRWLRWASLVRVRTLMFAH